ncbi:hypothetical protein [Pedobacter sp.]
MKTLKTILKSNLLGVFALIAAFGLVLSMSAFTASENVKRQTYSFYYSAPGTPDVDDVEEEDNWTYVAEPDFCDQELETACTITIDAEFVDAITNPSQPRLKQEAELQAAPSAGSAYVVSSQDSNMDIANKAL